VDEAGEGRRTIVVERTGGAFVPARSCVTSYPLHLIERTLEAKGAYVVDEIMRDEASLYVQNHFKWAIFSYVDGDSFAGRRLLDFGCGAGASIMVLSRMLPGNTEFVGAERVPGVIELARERARWYGIENRTAFLLSPEPDKLPDGIGGVDFVLLSAVFEHLLPAERHSVLPLLWRHLKPGGILFLNQTPYRWFPVERHTTGLPLINYLPDALALWTARRCSKRVRPDEKWSDFLRRGVRGATTGEILAILKENSCEAELLAPSRQGVRDLIDLWFRLSSSTRNPGVKRAMSYAFRAVKATTDLTTVPTLSLAIRKLGNG
jgi:SAM-dependent methyltransferase